MKAQTLTIKPEMIFNLFSDLTRLRCLALIFQADELCVCELTYALQVTQPKVSRHLALLKRFNLVAGRRDGFWIYYRINPDLPNWIQDIIKLTVKSMKHVEPYRRDKKRLEAMPNRPLVCQR